jgi:hypothetical protein
LPDYFHIDGKQVRRGRSWELLVSACEGKSYTAPIAGFPARAALAFSSGPAQYRPIVSIAFSIFFFLYIFVLVLNFVQILKFVRISKFVQI